MGLVATGPFIPWDPMCNILLGLCGPWPLPFLQLALVLDFGFGGLGPLPRQQSMIPGAVEKHAVFHMTASSHEP